MPPPPFRLRPLLAAALTAALAPAAVRAQDADFSEKLFRSGERAYQAQSYKEALETWGQLLQQAPKSDFAPQALLRMARYQAEVQKDPDAAMPYLDRVKAEYLNTRWAAEGLLMRGRLLAGKARSAADLKDAIAEFNRVLDLFPDSASVAEARYQLGQAALAQAQPTKALGYFVETFRAHPESPIARQAMLDAATALAVQGDLESALRLLQRVKQQAPKSPEAVEAAWRLTNLVRHRILKMPLKLEGPWPAATKVKWLKTPTLLAPDGRGGFLMYQDGLDAAFRFQGADLVPAKGALPSARVMAVGPDGEAWLLTKNSLLRPGTAPVPLPALSSASGALLDRWGNLWVSDTKLQGLTVVSPDNSTRLIGGPSLVALAALPLGMVGASDDTRQLVFLDSEGHVQKQIPYGQGLPAPFKEVVALTSDATGNVAALVDGGDYGEGLVVWGPDGALLRQATLKSLALAGHFVALAFDRSGGIILADRRNDTLYRVR